MIQKLFQGIFGWIISIVMLGAFLLVINGIFFGGQSLWHKSDNYRIKVIENELSVLKQKIDYYESVNQITKANVLVEEYNIKIPELNDLYKKVGTIYGVGPRLGSFRK